MAYTAMQITSEIMRQCNLMQIKITNLRLQKILYYIQIQSFKSINSPAFDDEIEAWRHGPVVRDVYNEYMRYIAFPIDFDDPEVIKNRAPIDKKTISIIHYIICLAKEYSAWELANRTKQTKPWNDSYIYGKNIIIKKSDIKKFGRVNL